MSKRRASTTASSSETGAEMADMDRVIEEKGSGRKVRSSLTTRFLCVLMVQCTQRAMGAFSTFS